MKSYPGPEAAACQSSMMEGCILEQSLKIGLKSSPQDSLPEDVYHNMR